MGIAIDSREELDEAPGQGDLSAEQYGEVCAYLAYFRRRRGAGGGTTHQVLERLGVSSGRFETAARHWSAATARELESETTPVADRIAHAFSVRRESLAHEQPTLDLVPRLAGVEGAVVEEGLPSPPADAGIESNSLTVSRRQEAPLAHPPNETARPTYLLNERDRSAESSGSVPVVNAPELVPRELPVPSTASSVARPGFEIRGEAQTVSEAGTFGSSERAALSLATEELPDPEELARLIRAADPRAAFARAQSLPKIASATSPEDERDQWERGSGDETLMVHAPHVVAPTGPTSFRTALNPVAVPTMSLSEYAQFRASLRMEGEEHAETWRRFGIASARVKDALQAEFASRFRVDPAMQAEFLRLFDGFVNSRKR